MDPWLISIVAFVAVSAFVGAVAYVVRDLGSTSTEDRLEVLTGRRNPETESRTILKEEILHESVSGLGALFTRLSQRLGNLRLFFEQADSPIRSDMFFALSLGCAALAAIGAWIARSPVPLLPVAGIVGSVLPTLWLWWRRRTRFKKFARQLPDALELIGRALRSGHSLASGLHLVVEEMPAPISTEFGMAYEEQNLGISIEQALKNMTRRMPNMDLRFFATAVAIQRQSGGDLAEILDKISYIIRERFKLLGQVQALTGEGRISGVVLMLLPVALFFAVYYLNQEYVMLLFTDPMGKKMIAFAGVMQIFGAIAIKKIVNIKV